MRWFLDKLLWGLLLAPPVGLVLWFMEGGEAPTPLALLALVVWEVVVVAAMRASGFSLFGERGDRGSS